MSPHNSSKADPFSCIFFNLSNVHFNSVVVVVILIHSLTPTTIPISLSIIYSFFAYTFTKRNETFYSVTKSSLISLKFFQQFYATFFVFQLKIKRIEMKEVKHVCVYVNLNNLHNYIFAQMNRFQKSFTNISDIYFLCCSHFLFVNHLILCSKGTTFIYLAYAWLFIFK